MNEDVLFAIRALFNTDAQLVQQGRKLFFGNDDIQGDQELPYVSCQCRETQSDTTFGQITLEAYDVEFNVFTQQSEPARCQRIMSLLRDRFTHATLPSGEFDTVGVIHTLNGDGPNVEDGVYEGLVVFEVMVQLSMTIPPGV